MVSTLGLAAFAWALEALGIRVTPQGLSDAKDPLVTASFQHHEFTSGEGNLPK